MQNGDDQTLAATQAKDALFVLGNLTAKFSTVERAPRYPDGHRETDVEHSFHLALSATELAASHYPELDLGLVTQFSLVHDLPEVYTGDVWTFNITDEQRSKKEAAEKLATERLLKELPAHTAGLLRRYEEQIEPEARFVRFIDKILPAIINFVAGDANTFKEDHKITDIDQLHTIREENARRLQAQFPEFPFLHTVWSLVMRVGDEQMFPNE